MLSMDRSRLSLAFGSSRRTSGCGRNPIGRAAGSDSLRPEPEGTTCAVETWSIEWREMGRARWGWGIQSWLDVCVWSRHGSGARPGIGGERLATPPEATESTVTHDAADVGRFDLSQGSEDGVWFGAAGRWTGEYGDSGLVRTWGRSSSSESIDTHDGSRRRVGGGFGLFVDPFS